jgi:hypothetical protein
MFLHWRFIETMKMKYTTPFLILIFMVGIAPAGVYEPDDLSDAYAYLNQIRVKAGMIEFSSNSELEAAAFNHANYLADNKDMGHYESAGTPGFTGVTWSDRAISAGYRSKAVSENVSGGNANSFDSIDALMSAIYHRFGFLTFDNDEVGIGIGKISFTDPTTNSAYVYKMGNKRLNTLCAGPNFSGFGSYYYGVCNPDINVEATEFDNAKVMVQGNNPEIVLWPVDGDRSVPPAFFEESPDPLPDYSVSGYPISVQFNPLSFTDVNVTSFRLYRTSDNSEVQPTRLLDQNTDPNGKFSALEFALFPLQRLDWNTEYRVEFQYTASGTQSSLIWYFTTKKLTVPMFTVESSGEILSVPVNQASSFAVYVPPTTSSSEIGRIRYRFPGNVTVNTAFEDGNTLLVNLSATVGDQLTFTMADGREFIVQITSAVTENTTTTEENTTTGNNPVEVVTTPVVTNNACEPATLSSDLKVHVPVMQYTFPGSNTPSTLWIDLQFIGGNAQYQVTNFDFFDMTGTCEGPSTLTSDVTKIHIPNLQYTFPTGETVVYWADLEFVGNFVFQVTDYGFVNN